MNNIITGTISTDCLNELIANKEDMFKAMHNTKHLPTDAGLTYAGRFRQYNLINTPSVSNALITIAKNLVNNTDMDQSKDIGAMSWVNYMVEGEKVHFHNHSLYYGSTRGYSACVYLHQSDTPIVFVDENLNAKRVYPEPGLWVLFPNNITHKVPRLREKDRLSIGIELFYTEEKPDFCIGQDTQL